MALGVGGTFTRGRGRRSRDGESATSRPVAVAPTRRSPGPEAWARAWFEGEDPAALRVISPVRRRRRPWYARPTALAAMAVAAAGSLGAVAARGGTPEAGGAGSGRVVTASAAADGLEAAVHDVSCGRTSVGDGVQLVAEGHFCLVEIAVRSAVPTVLHADEQIVFDAEERRYAGDRLVSERAAGSAELFEPLAAGRERVGVLAFDLPSGVEPIRIELRGSDGAGPVRMDLRG